MRTVVLVQKKMRPELGAVAEGFRAAVNIDLLGVDETVMGELVDGFSLTCSRGLAAEGL